MSSIDSIARTALKAFQSDLQVTGHNIANSQTIGFKQSKVRFADIYSTNLASNKQIGIGVKVASVDQDFAEGTSEITGRNLDLSINGQGFYVMRDVTSGRTSYTRAGQFVLDKDGFVTQNNTRMQGFAAFNGAITTNLIDLQITNTPLSANATTRTDLQLNLDSTAITPAIPFNSSNPSSYNHRTDNVIYDSLGKANNLTLFYIKTAPNTWQVQMEANGTNIGTGTLNFSTSGALTSATGFTGISWNPTGGATTPQVFDIDFTGTTQYASSNETRDISQNGYPAGVLTSYDFDTDGMLTARYSNGQSQLLGQIAIAKFSAPEGLANMGNTSWIETAASGQAILNSVNSKGAINPGTLELSNVDISQQLINLLNAQNSFQANSQVVRTSDQISQTILNIR